MHLPRLGLRLLLAVTSLATVALTEKSQLPLAVGTSQMFSYAGSVISADCESTTVRFVGTCTLQPCIPLSSQFVRGPSPVLKCSELINQQMHVTYISSKYVETHISSSLAPTDRSFQSQHYSYWGTCTLSGTTTASCGTFTQIEVVQFGMTSTTFTLFSHPKGANASVSQAPITAGLSKITSPTCDAEDLKIGLGVGIGVGVSLVIAALAWALLIMRRRHKARVHHGDDYDAGDAAAKYDKGEMVDSGAQEAEDKSELPGSEVSQARGQDNLLARGPDKSELAGQEVVEAWAGREPAELPSERT